MNFIRELYEYRELIVEFIKRDIKIKYRRSYFGVLWSLLNPFFFMVIMTAIFSTLFKSSIDNFPVYLLSGQIIVMFFSEATSTSMVSIIANSGMIKKIYFPRYIFCLSKVISSLVTLLASFLALILVIIIMSGELHVTLIACFLPFIYIFLFSLGISFILAASAVYFRDITHLYSVILLGWSYFTPTFYPLSILPSFVANLVMMNPLTVIVLIMRENILNGMIGSVWMHFQALMVSTIVFLFGLWVFKKVENKFILYI